VKPCARTIRPRGDEGLEKSLTLSCFGGHLAQHLSKGLRVLGPRNRPQPVQYVGRDSGNPVAQGLLEFSLHLGDPTIRLQKLLDLGSVEANVSSTLGESVGVSNVHTISEVGLEKTFLEDFLVDGRIRLVGQPEQAVCEQRVGAERTVHVELEPLVGGCRGHAGKDLFSLFHPSELAGIGLDDRACNAGRRCRVELKGSVRDFEFHAKIFGFDQCQARLEPALADVAPWAHDVGVDVDRDCGCVGDRHVHHRRPYCQRAMVGDIETAPADVQATFCATLVDEWVRLGVAEAVVAPGSRSTPMALALADCPEMAVHVVHDERSAGFVALGIGLRGAPALLLCTSGTAAANFFPAVVEAGLSEVPMIVLTADRPEELRGVGAPQTIDQIDLYGDHVRWFRDPGVPDDGERTLWRGLAGEAYRHASDGPVQLNLAFREPLLGQPGQLPEEVAQPRPVASQRRNDPVPAGFDRQRGVILVGGRSDVEASAVKSLHAMTDWPILADAVSGMRHLDGVVTTADALLRHERFANDHMPEVIVRIGRPAASKVLAQWSARAEATLIQVGGPGVIDPDHNVTAVCSMGDLLGAGPIGSSGTTWLVRWMHAEERADEAIATFLDSAEEPTEPGVARCVAENLPNDAMLTVASSMPIRDLEWFGGHAARAHANRGANGIDGVMSTALGLSLAGQTSVVLIGDLAFTHDVNALVGLAGRGCDLRIVVVDNDGGGIFSFLPQASMLPAERFEQLFGAPLGVDVVALAAGYGVPATTIATTNAMKDQLTSPGPWVARVPSNRADNVEVHNQLQEAVRLALD
jgi:2-succinyl-5-enolpyruvyl-6-hydroxy-3-cyclohexene-1-carboxylate synthase